MNSRRLMYITGMIDEQMLLLVLVFVVIWRKNWFRNSIERVLAHLNWRRRVSNLMATLYYAEHVHIAQTYTVILLPNSVLSRNPWSVSSNVNESFTVQSSVLHCKPRVIKGYGLLFCHSGHWTEKETSTGDSCFRLSTCRPRRASLSSEKNTSGR